MSSARIDEKAVFNAARGIGDAAAREAYLETACRDDAEAVARIRELLRAHEKERSFLESPAVASAAPEAPLESPGATIGPYKLLEQIGEGGFGVVFMAEQTAPVRRRVALKVIKPGMDTKQVIGRFEAERQALALMDHPNIARVFDAGTTGTARPYFVMELVRGVPITEYCDANRLTPRQRLELFVTVCHAVQHAHQKGVIHRDLKPSNVLVTLHDDRPVAKVIDFGIAKATGEPLTEKTVFTAFAQMVGTPLYMSPEQASLGGLDIDTRSDVYSLGVLLYELLTGTTPFEKSRLHEAAFDEVRRIIREEEPQRPSTRLSTSETLPSVAASRGTEPARLTRLVRGDLDWIVMKALEKDRTRRYETADGLAADVQRYLADEVVSACPPSAGYRLRKFVRRHKGALTVAALVAALLMVVAGSVGWIARDERARRVRTAEAVSVLLDQCEAALKEEASDRAAITLEAAERRAAEGGAGELEGRLARCRADLALLRALDAIDAFAWSRIGGRSSPVQETAAQWRAALGGYGITADVSRAEETAARVRESLVRDRVLNALDRWLVAEPSVGLRETLRVADPDPYREAVRDAVVGDRSALARVAGWPEALDQPARFAGVLGQLDGVPVARQRLLMESALRNRPGDLVLLMELGGSYQRECGYQPGREVERQAGAQETKAEWVRWLQAAVAAHPRNVAALTNLGVALGNRGDLAGAIACQEAAVRLDPTFVAAHSNLGSMLFAKGDLDGAVACLEEAIRLDPTRALSHYNLGTAFQAKGELDRAIACFEEAVRLDPTNAVTHYNLGFAFALGGVELARAVACFKEAIRLDPTRALSHYNLANALHAGGDPDGALACLEEAIRLDPNLAVAHCSLGMLFQQSGRFAESLDAMRRGHEIGRRQPGWSYPSGHWVQECERLVALETRLPHVLAGEAAGPDEYLALAEMCLRFKRRHGDAALLYGKAFAASPSLAESHRYDAACSAALAADGQRVGAEERGEADRARLRGLAFDWLRTELVAQGELPVGDPAVAAQVRQRLQHWLDDPVLSSVRDAQGLAILPEEERQRWPDLWSDVRGLIARAAKK